MGEEWMRKFTKTVSPTFITEFDEWMRTKMDASTFMTDERCIKTFMTDFDGWMRRTTFKTDVEEWMRTKTAAPVKAHSIEAEARDRPPTIDEDVGDEKAPLEQLPSEESENSSMVVNLSVDNDVFKSSGYEFVDDFDEMSINYEVEELPKIEQIYEEILMSRALYKGDGMMCYAELGECGRGRKYALKKINTNRKDALLFRCYNYTARSHRQDGEAKTKPLSIFVGREYGQDPVCEERYRDALRQWALTELGSRKDAFKLDVYMWELAKKLKQMIRKETFSNDKEISPELLEKLTNNGVALSQDDMMTKLCNMIERCEFDSYDEKLKVARKIEVLLRAGLSRNPMEYAKLSRTTGFF